MIDGAVSLAILLVWFDGCLYGHYVAKLSLSHWPTTINSQ